MMRASRIHLASLVLALVLAASLASPAEAVKVKDLATGEFITPAWFVNPLSPPGGTVVTVDPGDPKNFEIKVGASNFGAAEGDTQTSAIYGAGALLSPSGAGYQVLFSTQVYGWDSYDVVGYPAPGATGYWDVFAVNLNQTNYYWNLVNGGGGVTADPIITPDPAGNCVSMGPGCVAATGSALPGATWAWGALDYANNTFESNAGSYTLALVGSTAPYFLSVILDTKTTPQADAAYPSFGAFNPLSDVPPPALVPEPGTLLLLGSGLLGAAGYGWRRERRRRPEPDSGQWRATAGAERATGMR